MRIDSTVGWIHYRVHQSFRNDIARILLYVSPFDQLADANIKTPLRRWRARHQPSLLRLNTEIYTSVKTKSNSRLNRACFQAMESALVPLETRISLTSFTTFHGMHGISLGEIALFHVDIIVFHANRHHKGSRITVCKTRYRYTSARQNALQSLRIVLVNTAMLSYILYSTKRPITV